MCATVMTLIVDCMKVMACACTGTDGKDLWTSLDTGACAVPSDELVLLLMFEVVLCGASALVGVTAWCGECEAAPAADEGAVCEWLAWPGMVIAGVLC